MIPFAGNTDAHAFPRFIDRVAEKTRSADFVRRGLTVIGMAYLEEQRARFRAQANGGGEWQELARLTRQERKRLGFSPARPIMIRLGAVYNALTRGAPGNVFRIDSTGLSVGFGGPARHPSYEEKDNPPTIAEIARIQHEGRGRVPRRPLMVPPSQNIRQLASRELGNDLRSIFSIASRG